MPELLWIQAGVISRGGDNREGYAYNVNGNELIDQYFNTATFKANALGTFGTSPRNVLRGPGPVSFDLAVMKAFSVTERVKAQFRTEFFNAFNTPNFSNPYNVQRVATASAGWKAQAARALFNWLSS